ncbi:MAG: DUF2812 domain-containing protein [Eubacterium sp.]|nr:DUF2812 domain-containing protein [Eubacterium sp.]
MSNDKLKKFHAISYDNLEKTKDYLERMAREGWMLESISGNTQFIFKKCHPSEIIFSVEIFVNGSVFDTHTIESNMEFIDYCKEAGWNFVCSTGKIDIFYSEDPDTYEIQSDEGLKLKIIEKSCLFPRVLMPLLLLLMGGINLLWNMTINLNVMESSFLAFSALALWMFVILIAVFNLVTYFVWVMRARKKVSEGDKIPGRKLLDVRGTVIFLLTFALINSAFSIYGGIVFKEKIMYIIPLTWLLILGLFLIINRVTVFAEKIKMGRDRFGILSMVVIPVLFTALINIVIVFSVFSLNEENIEIGIDAQSLEIFGDDDSIVRREEYISDWGHFILGLECHTIEAFNSDEEKERGNHGSAAYTWRFDVYETEVESIHDRILKEAIQGNNLRQLSIRFPYDQAEEIPEWESTGIKIYHAEEKYEDDASSHLYLIYDDNTIISARCDTELNSQQMELVTTTFLQ